MKNALIKSGHETLSEISFRSKLYVGSLTAESADLTVDPTATVAGWSGDIWTADVTAGSTRYGQWFVGDHETCFTTDNCFDAVFTPIATAINGVENKLLKADLEVISTVNSVETVLNTLSYIVDGRDVAVALNAENSQQISATKNTNTLDDVASTATIFKTTSDTINIAVEETTTNQDTQVTQGSVGTTANNDAGFSSKPYGTDLKMGTWYFAEDNDSGTPTSDPLDTTFEKLSRQVLFKPNLTEIKALTDGDSRKSRLTITILNGTDEVAETTFEVTIEKKGIPIISFSQANAVVTATEGGNLNFVVSANFNPGANAIDVKYRLSETGTNYRGDNVEIDKALEIPLTFRPDGIFFTAEIPVDLSDPDTTNTGPGTISIVLDTPDSDALYEIDENNKSATATIVDTLLPRVSIEDASPTFNGTDIIFTLKSDIEVSKPFTIKVKPENSIGNFLDVSGSGKASGATRDIPNVRFPRTSPTQTTFSHELRIPTVIDDTLVEGEIDIELIADNSPTRPYNLSEVVGATTATAKIYRLNETIHCRGRN